LGRPRYVFQVDEKKQNKKIKRKKRERGPGGPGHLGRRGQNGHAGTIWTSRRSSSSSSVQRTGKEQGRPGAYLEATEVDGEVTVRRWRVDGGSRPSKGHVQGAIPSCSSLARRILSADAPG
jgi:hypothetical protein